MDKSRSRTHSDVDQGVFANFGAQVSPQPSEWCIRFAQMCRCVFTNRHKAVLLALRARQLDMLDQKDEKTTNRLECSAASMLPSSYYTSCSRTDRDPVPVAVLSSRRSEAMSSR